MFIDEIKNLSRVGIFNLFRTICKEIAYVQHCFWSTVHEKEKLRGRDPDKEDEEGGFGEYTRT